MERDFEMCELEDKKKRDMQLSLDIESSEELSDECSLSDLERSLPVQMVRLIQNDVREKIEKKQRERSILEEELSLVTGIITPVCITILFVLILLKVLDVSVEIQPNFFLYHKQSTDSTLFMFFGNLINAAIIVCITFVMTIIFVVLYYFHFMKTIFFWLIWSSWFLLATFGATLFSLLLKRFSVNMDIITFLIICWNFSVLGTVCFSFVLLFEFIDTKSSPGCSLLACPYIFNQSISDCD